MDFNKKSEDTDNPEQLKHKKEIRRMLEERLEQKKLMKELKDDFDMDFDKKDF